MERKALLAERTAFWGHTEGPRGILQGVFAARQRRTNEKIKRPREGKSAAARVTLALFRKEGAGPWPAGDLIFWPCGGNHPGASRHPSKEGNWGNGRGTQNTRRFAPPSFLKMAEGATGGRGDRPYRVRRARGARRGVGRGHVGGAKNRRSLDASAVLLLFFSCFFQQPVLMSYDSIPVALLSVTVISSPGSVVLFPAIRILRALSSISANLMAFTVFHLPFMNA